MKTMKIQSTVYGPFSINHKWTNGVDSSLLGFIGERNKQQWDRQDYIDSLHAKGQEFITKKLGL